MTICRLIHPLTTTTRPSKQSCWDRATIASTVQLVNGLGSNLPIHGTGTRSTGVPEQWGTGVASKHDKNGSGFPLRSFKISAEVALVEIWWNFYCPSCPRPSLWTALVDTFDTKGFGQISGSSNRQLIPTPERTDLCSDQDWALAPSLFHLQSMNACLLCSFMQLPNSSNEVTPFSFIFGNLNWETQLLWRPEYFYLTLELFRRPEVSDPFFLHLNLSWFQWTFHEGLRSRTTFEHFRQFWLILAHRIHVAGIYANMTGVYWW